MDRVLKIATRKSPLAVWQAEFVRSQLQLYYPELDIELVKMSTQGDQMHNSPLFLGQLIYDYHEYLHNQHQIPQFCRDLYFYEDSMYLNLSLDYLFQQSSNHLVVRHS